MRQPGLTVDSGEEGFVSVGVAPVTRRRALRAALAACGGVVAGGLVAGLPDAAASEPSSAQDVRILNFLLLLEELQAAFYTDAIDRGSLRGELLELARVVRGHERDHVRALRAELGSEARRKPELSFGDAGRDPAGFPLAAVNLEETTAAAYIGQGPNLTSDVIPLAAGIVSVEARHAAWLRDILGRNPAPRAADPATTADEALARLRRTGLLRMK